MIFSFLSSLFFKMPRFKQVYHSSLSKAEILQKLRDSTHENPSFFDFLFRRLSRTYRGSIDLNSFRIIKIIHYKNSFIPMIEGQIQDDPQGSRIEVTLTLQKGVERFMFSWLLGTFLMALIFLGIGFHDQGEQGVLIMLGPCAMHAFGRILMNVGFNREKGRILVHLGDLFEAS